MHNFIKVFLFTLAVSLSSTTYSSDYFPVKGKLRTQVDFWKKVYTQISTKEAFMHDTEDLSIIYDKVSLPKSRRQRSRFLKKTRNHLKKILRSIAKKDFSNLTEEEKKVAEIVEDKSPKELYQMARNIRFQYGLSDRYYQGLKRSYQYLDEIKEIFGKLNIPDELVFLPHVESSFNYNAYSKVGAAGIWQFMRSTARIYGLKVSYIVDERRDPIKATKAAGRLLRDNFKLLKSWPLALTAYNHGPRSMQRAIKKLGTRDINEIIENYQGRRFGFASKNFYATFMATVEISRDPEEYFPKFKKPSSHLFSTLKLDRAYTINQIRKSLGITKNTIKKFNPSIRRIAYRSNLYLPKGFVLSLPQMSQDKIAAYSKKLKSIKNNYKDLEFGSLHIVSRGETLYDISRIYKVSMSDLIQFNRISNPSRIYSGTKLKIPGKKDKILLAKTKLPTPSKPAIKAEPVKVAAVQETPKEIKTVEKEKKGFFSRITSIFNKPKKEEPKKKDVTIAAVEEPLTSLESYQLLLKKINKNIYQLTVETEETLGHYAEWAGVKTQSIRNLNGLRYRNNIRLGQKLLVKLDNESLIKFKQLRNEYHVSIQEDFYEAYGINGNNHYTVKRGDNLTSILRKVALPYWLVRKHQDNKKLEHTLVIGQKISIPKLKAKNEGTSLLPEDDS